MINYWNFVFETRTDIFIKNMNEKLAEIFTPLHPPAKLHYVPIVQHDVVWSAGVKM